MTLLFNDSGIACCVLTMSLTLKILDRWRACPTLQLTLVLEAPEQVCLRGEDFRGSAAGIFQTAKRASEKKS